MPARYGFRDIQSVFRAVQGGWKNGERVQRLGAKLLHALGEARAEVDACSPRLANGRLNVFVGQVGRSFRALVEQQPGATRIASETRCPLPCLGVRQWLARTTENVCSTRTDIGVYSACGKGHGRG